MQRILIVRGGAIGDFVLTLPTLKVLRQQFPNALIEILGYKHIVALADRRFYANATRSIEYAGLASFFAADVELPRDLASYFATFDLVVSYLFDPDRFFEKNIRRCGVEDFLAGPAKIMPGKHAAVQLSKPLEQLGFSLRSRAAELFPIAEDHAAAAALLPANGKPFIAIHPGSGSATKNWPIDRWIALGSRIRREDHNLHLVVLGGEADAAALHQLRDDGSDLPMTYVIGQPLTIAAALLSKTDLFIGHDSGISHIAAAAGARCVLLFGPTDPRVWAPRNPGVRVLQPPSAKLADLTSDEVIAAVADARAATATS